ncbi:protein of unknown function [Pseudomonas sp. JV551A1]|nr:protein of unknown function [Pseudomonas sp. JV551A1]
MQPIAGKPAPTPTVLVSSHALSPGVLSLQAFRLSCGSNCLGYLFKPALALVGAALCRDGARSGPRFSASQQRLPGPLRAPSRHKAAPTAICTWLEAGVV